MSVTGTPAEWRTNLETLRQALVAAQDERPKRQEWVTLDDGSTELAWVLHEREADAAGRQRPPSTRGQGAPLRQSRSAARRPAPAGRWTTR